MLQVLIEMMRITRSCHALIYPTIISNFKFNESNSLTQWQRKLVQLTRNLTRLKLKVSQLSMWSARRPGVEMTMCGFTDKSWPCFIMSVNNESKAQCKTFDWEMFSASSGQTENRQCDSNRCIYIYIPLPSTSLLGSSMKLVCTSECLL